MTLSTLETLRLTIAAIRQRTGESQRELAAALGLTQDKVSRRQSGAQSWSLDEVDALAGHWGMRPLDLLAGPTHAAQSLTWPPGTAAPHPEQPLPAPAAFTPTTAAPAAPPAAEVPAATHAPAIPAPPAAAVPAADPAVEGQEAAAPATPAAATAVPALAAPTAPVASEASPEAAVPAAAPAAERQVVASVTPVAAAVPAAAPAAERQVVASATPVEAAVPAPAAAPQASGEQQHQAVELDRTPTGDLYSTDPAPCVRCGRPTPYRAQGRPMHMGGWCTPDTVGAGTVQPAPVAMAAPAPAAGHTAPTPAGEERVVRVEPAGLSKAALEALARHPHTAAAPTAVAAPRPAARPTTTASAPVATAASRSAVASRPVAASRAEYAGTGRDLGYYLDMITSAVEQALEEHDGDTEAASAALEKKAIPNGMALFEATRVGAAYEHTVYPDRLEFLSKKTRNGADEIWEGRHKWENAPLMAALRSGTQDPVTVDVLDTNAAYCSALKTHLPIGALQHRPGGGWEAKRSGVYLLPKRPTWEHPHLPDPIGNRHEAGPVLLDEATVRLLIRCHKLGLADAPHITEAWTSGASEGLLEKFRRVLTQARENAIHDGDQVTEKYVKAMYAKFASTIGESTYNREIRRPDWMHIIRSQAFANLWYKAHRAHNAGLTIVALRGTDELHVTGGEWRKADGGVFEEGRLTTQLKLKDHYTLPRTRTRSA
ncbi:helix-turn-helix domain-containing protein [Kitasatospora griseola]|uniref:helix-turn-helix domain-containing protein n=1 Tax=Kitasatospora griseola TaxID=2064 RepID=UPI00342A6E5D